MNAENLGFSTVNKTAYELLVEQGKAEVEGRYYPSAAMLAKSQFYSPADVLNVYERSRITQSIVKRFNQLQSEKK